MSCSRSSEEQLELLLIVLLSAVSLMVAQEYEGIKEQLDLEQNLRVQAETYAHEVRRPGNTHHYASTAVFNH